MSNSRECGSFTDGIVAIPEVHHETRNFSVQLICRKWSREPSTFRAKSLRAGEKNPHKLYYRSDAQCLYSRLMLVGKGLRKVCFSGQILHALNEH